MKHSPAVEQAFADFACLVNDDPSRSTEERIKHALAEIIAPRHELWRRRAREAAEPIAKRHGVTVAALFGRRRAADVVAARDELCAELLARGWSMADVARALGQTRQQPARAAERHAARMGAAAKEGKRAHG